MIGVRAGLRVGLRCGIAAGIAADAVSPGGASIAGVARDATSMIYLPATAGQWNTLLAAANISTGNPSALHLPDLAAGGNLVDQIGTFTLTATGTLTYQQSVSGWSTKGIATSTGVSGTLASIAAGLPDISTTSMLAVVYVLVPATVATFRSIYQFGPTFGSQAGALLSTSSNKRMRAIADPNFLDGTDDATAQVRPFVLKVDRTAGACALYSDREKLAPALTVTPTGKAYTLGGDNTMSFFPDAFTYLYSAVFFAAAAEMPDAKVRTLLQTLGWTVLW